MALMDFTGNRLSTSVQLGNRMDYCYICQCEVVAKNDIEYTKKINELKGKWEGKPMLKIRRSGTETCVCMEHIHKIAKENPLDEKE